MNYPGHSSPSWSNTTYKWVKKIISDGSYEETTDIDASRNHARTEHTAA